MTNLVGFVVGTSAAYARAVHDANTLYFLSDTHQIMKGDYDYGSSVIVASSLPWSGIPSKLYVVNNKLYTYAAGEDGKLKWHLLWDLGTKADLTGAAFTGKVTLALDPVDGSDAATKRYVDSQVSAKDAMTYRGTIGTDGTIQKLPKSNVKSGDTYRVITAGIYAGTMCEIGDMLIALENKLSGSTDANWTVVQSNIDGAVIGPVAATADSVALFDRESGRIIKDSKVKLGVDTFQQNPAESVLATELGVTTYVESVVPTWKDF